MTTFHPVFLSVVLVVRNQRGQLDAILSDAVRKLDPLVSDYELIIVDNASTDDTLPALRVLVGESGYPNVQVYALTKEVNLDTAFWVGLENALGYFVAVLDPMVDDLAFLPEMLDRAVQGADVVYANNKVKPSQRLGYRLAYAMFSRGYRTFSGIDLAKDAPQYRLLAKRVVDFLLRHRQPAITYRLLPATAGFTRAMLDYRSPPRVKGSKRLGESLDRGMRMLVTTTRAPMRLVTALSLFGAVANLVYSAYVVAVFLLKDNIAPGWVSLSLQQSGMFFLISLVLLVLGEYILNMASLSNEGPLYHVGQEFTSTRVTRRERLNVEEATPFRTHPTAALQESGPE